MNKVSISNPGHRLLAMVLSLGSVAAIGFSVAGMVDYKPYGVPDHLRDQYDRKLASLATQNRLLSDRLETSKAKVYVEQSVWDFGTVDPGSVQLSHSFRIQNQGSTDLVLRLAGSTCKCTVSKLEKSILPPGEWTSIEVVWNTGGETSDSFSQSAFIETNDLDHRTLEFQVKGTVAAEWRYDRPFMMRGAPVSGEPMIGECLMYSQLYPSFVIVESEVSSDRLSVNIRSAEEDELMSKNAVAGYQIQVSYVGKVGEQVVDEQIRIHLADPETGKEQWLSIPFVGKYRSPVAFFGPDLEKNVGFRLGVVEVGSEKSWTFNVRFRADDEVSRAVVKDLSPKSLVATVDPIKSVSNTFRVTIKVAEGAVPVRFQGNKQGFIEIADADRPEVADWMPLLGQVIKRVED